MPSSITYITHMFCNLYFLSRGALVVFYSDEELDKVGVIRGIFCRDERFYSLLSPYN